MNRISMLAGITLLALLPLMAQQDLSGRWVFNGSKSQNIGMMAEMKLVATVKQTNDLLVITNATVFNGKESTSEIRLDLTGKPVPNKNPMEATAETISKWDGKKLVTSWSSPGSVAGSTSVRTETRSLSPDGKVLTVESSRGKSPSMVMVYDRQ